MVSASLDDLVLDGLGDLDDLVPGGPGGGELDEVPGGEEGDAEAEAEGAAELRHEGDEGVDGGLLLHPHVGGGEVEPPAEGAGHRLSAPRLGLPHHAVRRVVTRHLGIYSVCKGQITWLWDDKYLAGLAGYACFFFARVKNVTNGQTDKHT